MNQPSTNNTPTLDQLTGPQPIASQAAPTLDDLVSQPAVTPEQAAQNAAHQAMSETFLEGNTGEFVRPKNPAIYRDGKDLILVDGAMLSSTACIKSGRKAKKIVSVSLQNPFRPQTWFKGVDKLVIGLNKTHNEKYRINQTIAYALMGMGLVMLIIGALSSLGTAAFGVIVALSGLITKACVPVWFVRRDENSITIRGCGEAFTNQFPEKPQS